MSKRMRTALVALASAGGCWTSDTTPRPLVVGEQKPVVALMTGPGPRAQSGIVMTDTAIGPLRANVPVSQLGDAMPGYELESATDKAFPDFYDGAHVNVMFGGERVFVVIVHGDEVFNVHTDNPKVSVANHPAWRVGATFNDSSELSRCDCWGGEYVCWIDGEHAALAFARTCSAEVSDPHLLRVLDGVAIKRMVWNPAPFEGDKTPTTAPSPTAAQAPNAGSGNSGGGGGGGGDDDDDDDGN